MDARRRRLGLEAERVENLGPAQQLEILRLRPIVAILRHEQPAGIARTEIAERQLDAIGVDGPIDRTAPDTKPARKTAMPNAPIQSGRPKLAI